MPASSCPQPHWQRPTWCGGFAPVPASTGRPAGSLDACPATRGCRTVRLAAVHWSFGRFGARVPDVRQRVVIPLRTVAAVSSLG